MNYALALKVVGTVLPYMADVLSAPALKWLSVRVTIRESADTASIGTPLQGAPVITYPTTFCGVEVETDTRLYLGLTAHEIGHAPDLEPGLALLEQARAEGGASLAHLLNLVEDMRIESAMTAEPLNTWLTHTRQLVYDTELTSPPQSCTDLLMWLRFGNPAQAVNYGVPGVLLDAQRQAYTQMEARAEAQGVSVDALSGPDVDALARINQQLDFWQAACTTLREQLPQGIQGSYKAAKILWQSLQEAGEDGAELGERLAPLVFPPGITGGWGSAGQLHVPANHGQDDYEEWQIPHDATALAEGLRLARQLTHWWTRAPSRPLAVGVGRYNPRLEGRALPPFTLPLARQAAPPPKLALFLDVSGSMWGGDDLTREPLHLARRAAIAVAQAAKAAGGQVKIWAFCGHAIYLGDDLTRVAAIRGGNTRLDFLMDVAPQLGPDWHYLFITDAQIDQVPDIWDAAHRRKTAVLYIPDGSDTGDRARRLGDPVITIRDIAHLPHLTALAARRFFSTAARI